jgi:hypothetical protein
LVIPAKAGIQVVVMATQHTANDPFPGVLGALVVQTTVETTKAPRKLDSRLRGNDKLKLTST